MALASVIAFDEAPLRADLQQFYGIDLDAAASGLHTTRHIAMLVSQLPQESRLVRALNPDMRWSLTDVLLAVMVNKFGMYVWGISDKKRRGPKPPLVGPSYMTEANRKSLPTRVLPINELMEELSKPRRRANG